jgi:lysophospholipase L1-like esterase
LKNIKSKIIFAVSTILLVIVVLCCTGCIGVRIYVNKFIKDNYNRRVSVWQETVVNIPDGSIVFIGDSHTEYYALDEYFPEYPVINRGIYGDTTYGVKKRLDESVFSLNPSKVFLLIGANDINKTSDTNEVIAGNIREIITQIKDAVPETKIYLQSLYPVNRNGKNSNRIDIYKLNNKRISTINLLLESLCHDESIVYIDMFSPLTDDNGQLREDFTIEGLHLNAAGYGFVTEILRPYVE